MNQISRFGATAGELFSASSVEAYLIGQHWLNLATDDSSHDWQQDKLYPIFRDAEDEKL